MDYKKQGKKNRAAGQRFELKIRRDLENKNWIVDRWSNNIDLELQKLIPAKSRFGLRTTGFPDFVAFMECKDGYDIIGVECKSNGYLDKIEKEKCAWLLNNTIFSSILIASKDKKKRGGIIYKKY